MGFFMLETEKLVLSGSYNTFNFVETPVFDLHYKEACFYLGKVNLLRSIAFQFYVLFVKHIANNIIYFDGYGFFVVVDKIDGKFSL